MVVFGINAFSFFSKILDNYLPTHNNSKTKNNLIITYKIQTGFLHFNHDNGVVERSCLVWSLT